MNYSKINSQSNRKQSPGSRSGMALLFVVSLILFITLLGTSFVVVSQQFNKSAMIRTRIDATGDDSQTMVQRAMYELLRGPDPSNVASPLRGHSLLADMYGYGMAAEVFSATQVTYTAPADAATATRIGEYDLPGAIEITLDGATLQNLLPGGAVPVLSDIPGFFNGQVMTFTSGVLAGTSVRIVGYTGAKEGFNSAAQFTFIAYPEQSRDVPAAVGDLVGSRILINGKAYQGWGAGGAGAGDALAATALAPNRANAAIAGYLSTGVNESYDALDYQNMFLAGQDTNGDIFPSFERRELFRSQGGTFQQNFRAFGAPIVGGANVDPQVDTDGDGVEDSIWIDIGLPIQTDLDGRRYKPLVAYQVIDLDSKLSVNLNSSIYDTDQEDTSGDGNADSSDGLVNRATIDSGTVLLGNVDPLNPLAGIRSGLHTGQYLGPPEISLWSLFDRGSADLTPALFEDNQAYFQFLTNRYGTDQLPGSSNGRDLWNQFKQAGHPDTIIEPTYPNGFVGGYFGTYLDIHGRFTAGIPNAYVGNLPVGLTTSIEDSGLIPLRETGDSAYEFTFMDRSRFATTAADISDDQPYTVKELERILRIYDRDSRMLPGRLRDAFQTATGPSLLDADERMAITTHSFETPSIPGFTADAVNFPVEAGRADPISIVERTFNALTAGGFAGDFDLEITDLLSYETRMGMPFDLNRPFGDGRDDDGDGTYDEIDEQTGGNTEQLDAPDGLVNMNADVNNGVARYQFAKQLYVLALLVTGETNVITPNFTPGMINDATTKRQTLAQWAINVVDYRDSDSIYTPFEYDLNPFDADGWSADGDLTTADLNSSVVWGIERPEVLVSESFAFHDRRTEDLSTGGTVGAGTDVTYDSRLVPNASVFFELYRPWTANESNQLHPRELGATAANNGIDLRQVSPGDGSPTWRMVVSGSETIPGDANFNTLFRDVNTRPGYSAIPEAQQVRRIYFVQPPVGAGEVESDVAQQNKVYFPSGTVQGLLAGNSSIQPGGVAVIGSAGKINGGAYETWIGRRSTPTWDAELAMTRGYSLFPGTAQVEVRDGLNGGTTNTFDAVAIPIDATTSAAGAIVTRSLGISDPRTGYYDYDTMADVVAVDDGFAYVSTRDDPADLANTRLVGDEIKGTFSSVYLQRLANPSLDYDAVTNPYLTVDRQAIDMTVFNGAVADDSDDPVAGGDLSSFVSNERGRGRNPEVNSSAATYPVELRRRLWPIEGPTEIGEVIGRPANPLDTTHFFKSQPYASIGTLNRAYTNATFDAAAPVGFANLQWNNRPFANRFELMDVPFTDSYQLLSSGDIGSQVGYSLEKSQLQPFSQPAEDSPYDRPVRGGWNGHLLNFYSAAPLTTDPDGLVALFDYVRVPSRFVGTDIHVSNSQTLAAPTNKISRFREPGKININTALHPKVKTSLYDWFASATSVPGEMTDGSATTFTKPGIDFSVAGTFEGARRGAVGTTTSLFDNPFRTAGEFVKTPPGIDVGIAVNATMFRYEHLGAAAPAPGDARDELPVLQVQSDFPWADPDRSSYHRNELFRRLGATTTTRSSVFAIWVTIGRFEVDENDQLVKVNLGLPTERGVEIGAEYGKAERNRGFFIVDRSIPVGFEPGANHNVEKMILTESVID